MALPNNFSEARLAKAFNPIYQLQEVTYNSSNEYQEYVENGHPQAIHMLRTYLGKALDVRNKWFDIRFCSSYETTRFGLLFNFIIVDVFNRKIQPDYKNCLDPQYHTWCTATEDIAAQRKLGVKPKTFLIMPSLVSVTKPVNLNFKIASFAGNYAIVGKDKSAPYSYKGVLPGAKTFIAKSIMQIKDRSLLPDLIHGAGEVTHLFSEKGHGFRNVEDIFSYIDPKPFKPKPPAKKKSKQR